MKKVPTAPQNPHIPNVDDDSVDLAAADELASTAKMDVRGTLKNRGKNNNKPASSPTSSLHVDQNDTFEGGFKLFQRRIRQCPVPAQNVKIETIDDVDFVLIVNRPVGTNTTQRKLSSLVGTACYEYVPEDLEQKRVKYLDTLRDIYRISYRHVVGKTSEFYLIHLTYYHLGLLAEILRYQWQMKTQDKTRKIAFKNFNFFKWIKAGENKEFLNCESRDDFSHRLRYDLAYQFLIGAMIPLESPEKRTTRNCCCCPKKDSEIVYYDLLRVIGDKLFDDWMVPHTPLKLGMSKSKLAKYAPCCIPCLESCQVATGDNADSPIIREGQELRDFLSRYCTLKTALLKHHYPSVEHETAAGADLWHIIPVHQVNEYVGEKIGFYFAWAELLVLTMFGPAIIGAGMFIGLAIYYSIDVYGNHNNTEIKSDASVGEFIQYVLVKTCDNYATPIFAVLMVVWGTCFREMWIRREAWYRFLWNVEDLDVDELAHVRGERSESSNDDDDDPRPKPVKSGAARFFFFTLSTLTTLFFIALVFASVYAINVINLFSFDYCPTGASSSSTTTTTLRPGMTVAPGSITAPPAKSLKAPNQTSSSYTIYSNSNTFLRTQGSPPASSFGGSSLEPGKGDILTVLICNLFGMAQVLANSMSVFVLDLIYTVIAYKLTDGEGHLTPSRYTNALVVKLFTFRFFNFYSVLFFTAFGSNVLNLKFLSQLVPGSRNYEDGSSLGDATSCGDQPCLMKLTKQLLGILITQPIFYTIYDLILPSINSVYQVIKQRFARKIGIGTDDDVGDDNDDVEDGSNNSDALANELEKQGRLLHLSPLGKQQFTAEEFTQRIIIFGALVMFSVALPPAAALTILFMRVDLTLDIRRIVTRYKRPIPHRADGIGLWDSAVNLLTYLGLITNPLIVVLTSTWGSQFDTWWKFWIFIIFEHVTIALRALVAVVIPDVPQALEHEKFRRKRIRQEMVDELVLGKEAVGNHRKLWSYGLKKVAINQQS